MSMLRKNVNGIALPSNFNEAVRHPSTTLRCQELTMEDFFRAAFLENEIEAQLLDSILTQRDIPHLIRSYYDTAYDGLFQTQLGWGYVSSPSAYQEEIREILSDLRKEASRVELSSLQEDEQ
jgi:hypothetical protein